MSLDPIELSRRGDEAFGRLAARFPAASKQRLAIDHTLDVEGKDYKITTLYEGAMQHGHVYLADVRALHQTVRHRAKGVRVSIVFDESVAEGRERAPDADDRPFVPYIKRLNWVVCDTQSEYLYLETICIEHFIREFNVTSNAENSAILN